MRRSNFMIAAIGALTLLLGAVANAHHSNAMFDDTKIVTLSGTVKVFQYTQPHTWLVVLVPNNTGGADMWRFELQAPTLLLNVGIEKDTFRPGDKVTVECHPLKDGRTAGSLVSAVTASGKRVGNWVQNRNLQGYADK